MCLYRKKNGRSKFLSFVHLIQELRASYFIYVKNDDKDSDMLTMKMATNKGQPRDDMCKECWMKQTL